MNLRIIINVVFSAFKARVLFFLFLIAFCNTSYAQNYIHYTIDNGLPSDELYNALQDRMGLS